VAILLVVAVVYLVCHFTAHGDFAQDGGRVGTIEVIVNSKFYIRI